MPNDPISLALVKRIRFLRITVVTILAVISAALMLGIAKQEGCLGPPFPRTPKRIVSILSLGGAFIVLPVLLRLSFVIPNFYLAKRLPWLTADPRSELCQVYFCQCILRIIPLTGAALFLVAAYWAEQVLAGRPLSFAVDFNIIPLVLVLFLLGIQFPLRRTAQIWIEQHSQPNR